VSAYTQDSLSWCQRLLAETGVAITPGVDFDPVDGGRYVRFSFAGSAEDIDEGVRRLGAWLGQGEP
jgi:aspartate/methionine/tyrosine aminotransferase